MIQRHVIGLILIWLLIGLIVLVALHLKFRVNFSGSMPRGIYRVVPKPAQVDDDVEVCLPHNLAAFGIRRGYLGDVGHCPDGSEPLVKQVVAMGGDTITVAMDFVAVNGKRLPYSATLKQDEKGLPVAAIERGIYVLKPDEVWLMGTHSTLSWDSRYYGALKKENINAVVKPLLTWPWK